MPVQCNRGESTGMRASRCVRCNAITYEVQGLEQFNLETRDDGKVSRHGHAYMSHVRQEQGDLGHRGRGLSAHRSYAIVEYLVAFA